MHTIFGQTIMYDKFEYWLCWCGSIMFFWNFRSPMQICLWPWMLRFFPAINRQPVCERCAISQNPAKHMKPEYLCMQLEIFHQYHCRNHFGVQYSGLFANTRVNNLNACITIVFKIHVPVLFVRLTLHAWGRHACSAQSMWLKRLCETCAFINNGF